MRRMLSRIFHPRATTTRRAAQKKIVPQIEALESRWCLSTTVSINAGVLTIVGDNRVNDIHISDNGNGNLVVMVLNQPTNTFANVDRVVIDLKGGKDNVTYIQSGDRTRSLNLTANLGGDADGFYGEINGDILNFHVLQIKVDGGGARDIIGVHANRDTDVHGLALLKVDLNGGDGNDNLLALYEGKADGELRLNARAAGTTTT